MLEGPEPHVVSEYLPGEEYTVDCVSDGDGALLHAAPRRRTRVKAGISVRTEPAADEADLLAMAALIAAELRLRGAWFLRPAATATACRSCWKWRRGSPARWRCRACAGSTTRCCTCMPTLAARSRCCRWPTRWCWTAPRATATGPRWTTAGST
ncbi:ATP-grasp domain-containing protein [Pseudoxanthomonas sp. NC8]|nr:ATP-grasp domain-containing protein [Pseudoxanthomonas sp. NC8]